MYVCVCEREREREREREKGDRGLGTSASFLARGLWERKRMIPYVGFCEGSIVSEKQSTCEPVMEIKWMDVCVCV